jgi:hypothetical protein
LAAADFDACHPMSSPNTVGALTISSHANDENPCRVRPARFWDGFFSAVGDVDVVLDDGGHTNEQQIITAHNCIPHIKNGGRLIVEDTRTSYLQSFWNPSRYSFINYSKRMVDRINCRFRDLHLSDDAYKNAVYSMGVHESIVCFNIDREHARLKSRKLRKYFL